MMPLAFAKTGDKVLVARIGGNEEGKKDGNIIVNLKESRLAITSQMAAKIMIS